MKRVICGDSLNVLPKLESQFDLVFFDPPFNQNKKYSGHDDKLSDKAYWSWVRTVLLEVYQLTVDGGSIYFMQREKNIPRLHSVLTRIGWTFQNYIIWQKVASHMPGRYRFGKGYQVIGYYTKGVRPNVFNLLRQTFHNPAYKQKSESKYIDDVWVGIREMTSGWAAGLELIETPDCRMFHKQQSPVGLLLRILLASTLPGSLVLDPFAGTGTSLIVANQLKRGFVGIEKDPVYYEALLDRFRNKRAIDDISRYREFYSPTLNLSKIW